MNSNNKQLAAEFLGLVVSGKIDEAYEKYVDMSGKHHNAYYAAGFAVLRDGMKENHKQFPSKQFTIKNVLSDGDFVAVHSYVVLKAGELEIAVVHLFKFANEKIVEMWDVGQRIPKDLPNKDGMF